MDITRFSNDGRPESDIDRSFQKKVITFSSVPSLKQLEDGQIGKVYSDGNLNLYIRHKGYIFQVGSAVTDPIDITPDSSGSGGGGSNPAPPTGGGTISLKYNTTQFKINTSGQLELINALPTGIQGNILYHNGTAWTTLSAGTSGQFLQTLGAGANPQWATAGGGGVTAHDALTNLAYAVSGHTGFEPTVTKGNLTAGSTKVSIGGTGTGAVIGVGVSVDVAEANINHNSLLNTHNLTTDIDHNSITNTHNLTTSIDHNAITNSHNLTTSIDHNSITNTHNLTTSIDHDSLTNFSANEHIDHSTISVLAGTGMSGGGTINGNVTLNCSITQYTDALARLALSETITGIDYTNTTGVFSLTTGYVIPTTTEQSNWNSAYGAMHSAVTIVDTNSINLSLTGQQISADLIIQDTTSVDLAIDSSGLKATVLPAGVDHNSLLNYSANAHVDHSAVSILNGNGITGGGDLTASRTLALTTLTSDWDIGASRSIQAEKIIARSNLGLSLFEDGGVGLFVKDGGLAAGFGTVVPATTLPNGFVAGRLFEVKSNALNKDVGLTIRRYDDDNMGLDIWTQTSSGLSYIDNRFTTGTIGFVFRTGTSGTPNDCLYVAKNVYGPQLHIGSIAAPLATLKITGSSQPDYNPLLHLVPGSPFQMFVEAPQVVLNTHTIQYLTDLNAHRQIILNGATLSGTVSYNKTTKHADVIHIASLNVGSAYHTITGSSAIGIPIAPQASANCGLVSFGSGAWDGATAGYFVGSANGTTIAVNNASGYSGDMINLEVAGISAFKVSGSAITFGNVTADNDITVNFTGTSNSGVLKWMEDEDYFEFSDDLLLATTEKVQFRDTAIYINSTNDGYMDLVADTGIRANDKIMLTPTGGIAIKLINKSGANSVAGKIVSADTTTNDAVDLTPADGDMPMGVFYEDGVADGQGTWVVVAGIADVLFKDNVGATRGYVVYMSDEEGYAIDASSLPAVANHNREIGHTLQTTGAGGAGTHIKARVNLHWN